MNKSSSKPDLTGNIKNIVSFLQTDIWRIRTAKISKGKSVWIKQLRIVLLALRGFAEDKCQLRASALTFYSLLSVVPVFAMAFGIAKGFGLEQILEKQLTLKLPGQEEIAAQIIQFSNSFLENTKGGLIAGVGVAGLFWIVIKVLGNIENSFNDIWGIKTPRPLMRRFSDYLSIMLICPILIIMASSLTVLVTSQVKLITEKIAILGVLSPLIFATLKILPYCVIWFVFSFIYVFIPNTKVRIQSGILGGIIAGTIYQVVQWGYITFQVGVSKYGAIYGSFAALPLFLIWLQLSWLIVLFGAEVSFAEQNVDTYEFEPDCLKVSESFKKTMALNIVHLCIKNFLEGKKPLNGEQISQQLDIPVRLLRQLLFELVDAGVLLESRDTVESRNLYLPARDVSKLSVLDVLSRLEKRGTDNIPVTESRELKEIIHSLREFENTLEKSPANKILKDI